MFFTSGTLKALPRQTPQLALWQTSITQPRIPFLSATRTSQRSWLAQRKFAHTRSSPLATQNTRSSPLATRKPSPIASSSVDQPNTEPVLSANGPDVPTSSASTGKLPPNYNATAMRLSNHTPIISFFNESGRTDYGIEFYQSW